ncbi:MAG: hypothetical protein JXA82_16090 [Sedimentisphaerales bacterium]|nr:hypothetical protein [Sedimentisphaerales bacterium]
MRTTLQIISWLSLVALVVPSILYLAGSMELDRIKAYMMAATVVWFVSASLWMWKDTGPTVEEEETVI